MAREFQQRVTEACCELLYPCYFTYYFTV